MSVCAAAIQTYHPGTPAKWETLQSGLIPCRVLEVFHPPKYGDWPSMGLAHWFMVKIQLTADRGPWKKDEVIETFPMHVWPVDRIRKGQYFNYVCGGFRWAPKE